MSTLKEKDGKRIVILVVALVVILVLIFALMSRLLGSKVTNTSAKGNDQGENTSTEEENYSKLKQLYSEYESELSGVVNGFTEVGIISGDEDLDLYLDERIHGDGNIRWVGPENGNDSKESHHCSQGSVDRMNQNQDLCNIIKEISKEDQIREILYDSKTQELQFQVPVKNTPFLKSDGEISAIFLYSTETNPEKDGYRLIKDNWYMKILPKSK